MYMSPYLIPVCVCVCMCVCADINVEHIQLLVFLLHGLPLMQKKGLLLQLSQCVVKVVDAYHTG